MSQYSWFTVYVHRLTTNGLDVQFGLTAENLKDDLCLYLPMPEEDADFLLSLIKTTLRDIMTTVSGQFIIYNDSNNQYYIDVDKIVDYDEKIKQKASIMADGELNRYFYDVVYRCLEWDAKQYVTNFNIYEYDLNWDSHNMFREGYLFMGLPGERSTAQPELDFYIHIMPPYDEDGSRVQNLPDEVYLYFKSSDEFREFMGLYAQRRGKIQEGRALASLRKLRSIEILSAAKLTDIETEMSSIKVCYELTPEELKSTHICPHCRYHLEDKVRNVYSVLDNLGIRIDDLLAEWTKTLLDTISDPIVASQKTFLSAEQQKAIDEFIASGALPKRVDDFFAKAINALLKGFEPVVIDTDDLMAKLEQSKIAEEIGTSAPYVSRIVNSGDKVLNKTFVQIMESLGYDVELTYVKREE